MTDQQSFKVTAEALSKFCIDCFRGLGVSIQDETHQHRTSQGVAVNSIRKDELTSLGGELDIMSPF